MRKNRVIEQNRCCHLIRRRAHRAFFLKDEGQVRAVALMRRVEAGVQAGMSYCINRAVSISSCPLFMLEKDLTYSVTSLLQNCNAINMALHGNVADLTPFINRLKVTFLPPRVYDLEEYGLPRMISRKIHSSGLLDLERDVSLAVMLDELRKLGRESVIHKVPGLSAFDEYILDHLFDGIRK